MKTLEEMADIAEEWATNWKRDLDDSDTILKQTHKAAAPQWIGVKDRLPEDNSGLLLVYNSRLKKIGTSYWNEGIWCGGTWPVTSQFITYWMPIPELPKEEE
jgi:hypothetical protein